LKASEFCAVLLSVLASTSGLLSGGSAGDKQDVVGKTVDCTKLIKRPLPQFTVQRSFRGDLRPMLFVFMSMKGEDINEDNLISLSCEFDRKYAAEPGVDVFILDDSGAAKVFSPVGDGNTGETEKSYRAHYGFLKEIDSHFLSWRPDPKDRSKWVDIHLGKLTVPKPK
jgi:hypothetical protein